MARTHRPWGRETPGTRLRSTAARAREGLNQVDAPGFGDIDARVRRAVTESRALLEALEYIARTGFRGTRARDVDSRRRGQHSARFDARRVA